MTKVELIQLLSDSRTYFLCGSRFFAQKFPNDIFVTEFTDWDFFAQYSDDGVKFLQENNFIMILDKSGEVGHYVGDDLLHSIWKNEMYNIQVILRTDAKTYKEVIDRISMEFYRDYLWKSSPTRYGSPVNKADIQAIFNQLFKIRMEDIQ